MLQRIKDALWVSRGFDTLSWLLGFGVGISATMLVLAVL